VIRVEKLEKAYGGRLVLKGVSFEVKAGEVLGFLGPNGAGKTTTMKILAGLIAATGGRASIAGFDVQSQSLEVRRRIGYLPEQPPLYREMTVRGFLRFIASIRNVPPRHVESRVEQTIKMCGLSEVRGRIIGRLSKGFRQRVGLAQAIVHDPDVLILDEPTVGLDPKQIVEIRSLVKGFGGSRTVILSTHILPEVTMTCERVVIIHQGSIVAEDTIANLTAGGGRRERISVTVGRDLEAASRAMMSVAGVCSVVAVPGEPCTCHVTVEAGFTGNERLAAAVVSSGVGLIEMRSLPASLEDVFLNVITEEQGVSA